ncbi:methionine--tRNA ligase [Paenibacillus radicis (ex Gao et al. 2016)]|uniref:Methionine--tRNA ligase n=1 Tax=Paenibacillus radicis (ex Gao et al. 2016) TaxID=1737354 RepID=A0A917LVC3_9BACL|nr:methionine--tRNA ligase [Paenibacillus radicis (ex Gao et al. 2016)]GGG60521.1 methionine--tRNA ligase 1 [Paenibacillus radicis (ex Gao et al. 2016)]
MGKVFIGGAWPYANGSLHLGRLASLLPGDVLARYFRAKGEEVLYVSGSDCHGTPVAVQAIQEGVSPGDIADRYHQEFVDCFQQLGFTYDLYTRTDQPFHHQVVQELFLSLLNNGYLYKKTVLQTYCETDQRFLPDRYVEGTCPVCGNRARGDQCDYCSTLLDPSDLTDKTCKICGNPPVDRPTEHYYLALSRFQAELTQYAAESQGWKDNALQLTRRYLEEGLQDRAVTRDLTWGVDVPVEGFEDKKIYVWIEAVSGYLSASKQWAAETGGSWEDFWSLDQTELTAYYVHGKDNIPFHAVIWPALLMGAGELHLPDRIISSEYMTLEGKKFSTSNNWAVWVPDMLSRYQPDSIRYFLIANGPENRDTDFSWREFIHSHNGELLGAFGNFVNRTLAFIDKSFEGLVPDGELSEEWETAIEQLYDKSGALIEAGRLKEAIELIFSSVRQANKFFDEQKPWVQIKEGRATCGITLNACVQIIANLANLLNPFLPFACEQIRGFLSLPQPSWTTVSVSAHREIHNLKLLFERIDIGRIEEETAALEGQKR